MREERLSLGEVQDILLPCVWDRSKHLSVEVDLRINFQRGELEMKAFNLKTKRAESAFITANEIESGEWKEVFAPRYEALVAKVR